MCSFGLRLPKNSLVSLLAHFVPWLDQSDRLKSRDIAS
jgi:hypothetical protein